MWLLHCCAICDQFLSCAALRCFQYALSALFISDAAVPCVLIAYCLIVWPTGENVFIAGCLYFVVKYDSNDCLVVSLEVSPSWDREDVDGTALQIKESVASLCRLFVKHCCADTWSILYKGFCRALTVLVTWQLFVLHCLSVSSADQICKSDTG